MTDETQTPEVESTEQVESTESLDTQQEQPDILDLDSVEKFRFADKEWTPSELRNAYLMQSDYTRKTQALAEERKYAENLSTDLQAVLSNPELVEQFKSVYPKKYHAVVDNLLERHGGSQHGEGQTPNSNQRQQAYGDPQLNQRLERLESQLFEREVQAASQELDGILGKMNEKYPYAKEREVLAMAQSLMDQGHDLDQKAWDRLYQASQKENEGRFEKFYSEKVGKQKEANSKGKDMGAGGGIMGRAPVKPRTIKEASEYALQELQNS